MEQIVKKILEKENIPYNQIIKATSGFTNVVYFADDKFVVKISKDEKTIKKLDKEISIYQNINLDYIPKYIASGAIDDCKYLIITKVKGKSLYSIWHTLSSEERKSCIVQIAKMLNEFNNQNHEFLDKEYMDSNWIECITNELKARKIGLEELGFDTRFIEEFISQELPELFEENEMGLVYNDAHFDNFIYDEGKLSLIDFDRVRVCPIDYEMLIFKTMCDNPSKFASEDDEEKINDEDYAGIYEIFKNNYKEMFVNPKIDRRIKIYQFNYLMGQAIKCKNKDWIRELLSKFDNNIINII